MKALKLPLLPSNTSVVRALDRLELSGRSAAVIKTGTGRFRLLTTDDIMAPLVTTGRTMSEEKYSQAATLQISGVDAFAELGPVRVTDRRRYELDAFGLGNPETPLPYGFREFFENAPDDLYVVAAGVGEIAIVSRSETLIQRYRQTPKFCRCGHPQVSERHYYPVATHPRHCPHALPVICGR